MHGHSLLVSPANGVGGVGSGRHAQPQMNGPPLHLLRHTIHAPDLMHHLVESVQVKVLLSHHSGPRQGGPLGLKEGGVALREVLSILRSDGLLLFRGGVVPWSEGAGSLGGEGQVIIVVGL